MDLFRSQSSRTILALGLLSGAFILFTGAVGMIAAFHEREVVYRFISLGQLLLLIAPFVTSYYVAGRLDEHGAATPQILAAGLAVGLLTAIPSVILLLFNSDEFRFLLFLVLRLAPFVAASAIAWHKHQAGAETQAVLGIWLLVAVLVGIVTFSFALIFEIKGDLRSVLVNIDRDWVDVITFDNRKDLPLGIATFGLVSIAAGFAGSVLYLMPAVPRRALIYGLGITALVGAFGETARLVLQENVDRDTLRRSFAAIPCAKTPRSRSLLSAPQPASSGRCMAARFARASATSTGQVAAR